MFEELIKLCANCKDLDCNVKFICMLTAGETSSLVAKFKKHLP